MFFFFSSRRRHTSCYRDWSSDVCSSDLDLEQVPPNGSLGLRVPGVSTVVEAEHGKPLKVLVATAELAPFAKMGGIADVAASLSKELRRLGHDVRAVLPRYRQVDIAHYG